MPARRCLHQIATLPAVARNDTQFRTPFVIAKERSDCGNLFGRPARVCRPYRRITYIAVGRPDPRPPLQALAYHACHCEEGVSPTWQSNRPALIMQNVGRAGRHHGRMPTSARIFHRRRSRHRNCQLFIVNCQLKKLPARGGFLGYSLLSIT